VGRALSFSLVAHAAFILSFLLLSATRHVLPVAPVVRPVRLVTYLEPGGAPRARAAGAAPVARAPSPIAVPAPPPQAKTTATAAAAAPPAPAAVAVPRVIIPVPGPAATAPAAASAGEPAPVEPRPALGERLAKRLASSGPAQPQPPETAPPRIAKLPPIDAEPGVPAAPARLPAAGAPPGGGPAGPGAAPPRGAVEPVGYFPHAWYLAYLKEEIFARWVPPSEFFQSRSPVALVSFRITRAGKLEAVALKQGSGAARFDQSALAAVQGLGRLPPLPEQYPEETLDVVIRFQNQR
jgi:TonB family protein